MTTSGLNWFQARDLGRVGYAIRRIGWTAQWLIWRFGVWLIADATGPLRVAQNSDFGAGEFMAKDWTTDPPSGASVPPCCNPVAPAASAPNATGGQAAWSADPDLCGGGGSGGNLPVVSVSVGGDSGGGTGGGTPVPSIAMHYELSTAPGVVLVPDGGDHWVTVPTANVVLAVTFANVTHGTYVLYIAPPGANVDLAREGFLANPVGSFVGVAPLNSYYVVPVPGLLTAGMEMGNGGYVFYFGAVATPSSPGPSRTFPSFGYGRQAGQDALVTITPGQTWHAKLCQIYMPDPVVSGGLGVIADRGYYPLRCSMTVPPLAPAAFSAAFTSSQAPNGSDIDVWVGPDGVSGTADDVTESTTPCWTTGTMPSTHDLTIAVTLSGGIPGAGTLTVTAGSGGSQTATGSSPGTLTVTFTGLAYAAETFTLDWLDVNGAHHTATATFHAAPICVNNGGAGGIEYSPTP